MPKIMYRPNPTPPPFVPPVPPVPTDPYVTMSPFPFDNMTQVVCSIHNVKVDPSANNARLYVYNDKQAVIDAIGSINPTQIGAITLSALSKGNSDNVSRGEILIRNGSDLIEKVNLLVYQP